MSVGDDTIFYEIVTRFWHPTITKIKKLDPDSQSLTLIAELEREPGKEPRLRWGENEEWIKASDWLKAEEKKMYVYALYI